MAKLLGGTTIEGLLTVDADIETDEGDVILDSSTNTIDLGVLPTGSGNGLDADLLDGMHAGDFVDASGDTMTGAITWTPGNRPVMERDPTGSGNETNGIFEFQNIETANRDGWFGFYDGGGIQIVNEKDGAELHVGSSITLSGATNSTGNLSESGNRVATRTWAQNTATVNNADLLDGEHASAFADAGHTHDGRYYTESESDSNFAASGHNHDGDYILESGDTMSGVLTLNDGSVAASEAWVNNNADVPNADYADSAGDADTLDGYDANQLGVAQSSASFTSTDTTTDINKTSWTQIPWDVEKNVDAPYTHDAANSPEQITFDEAGTYQVYVSLAYSSTTDDIHESPGVKFAINGTLREAIGMGGYIRNGSDHDDASTSLMEVISVSAGDTLTVETYEKGGNGVVTLNSQESTLEISSISSRTLSQGDADTLDGFEGADFLLSAGGSMTGNLNATDSITVTRGGTQMDSNNSIEGNGDWLGLDSNSTGTGVLVGYYNADEVRVGNGNLSDFSWNSETVATRPWALGGNIDHADLGTTSSSDHHAKYTDSEAVSAVNAESSLSVSISGDSDSVDGYDIQKNGTDGSGVINFKT